MFKKHSNYSHQSPIKTGVLITNLGTPDAPTAKALRRYLGEFLWDNRVVEVPRPIWWLILHGIILRIRPHKVAKVYNTIWTPHGSPLLYTSQQIAETLSQSLTTEHGDKIVVALGMRYGNPSIESALESLRDKNIERLVVLPMYPQYSASTTASTFDKVFEQLSQWRWMPELRTIQHYADHPLYISAVAKSIKQYWAAQPKSEKLLISFHGIPKRYLTNGDPYYCYCHKTARLIAEELSLSNDEWMLVFQSRFGREEWLKPYCDKTLESFPRQGIKNVDVVCPGFSVDCLETLEEMAMTNKELFIEAGGESLNYIPALNNTTDHIELFKSLVNEHTQGWTLSKQASQHAPS